MLSDTCLLQQACNNYFYRHYTCNNEYDKKIEKMGFTLIFKYEWILFCLQKQQIMFKHDMTQEEQQKYMNQDYYSFNLPGLNYENNQRSKKNQTVNTVKNPKIVLDRISTCVKIKVKKKN